MNFFLRKLSIFTDRQMLVNNVADPDTFELHYRMANRIEHLADLLVMALIKRHLIPAVFVCGL